MKYTLSKAIIEKRPDLIKRFVEAGVEINIIDEYGYTPIIQTAIMNDIEAARYLIDHGADVGFADMTGGTALHWAVESHNLDFCKLLLDNGADPNTCTTGGESSLVKPYLKKQEKLKQLLYEHNADLNLAQDFINAKLLGHRFELKGHVDIIRPNGEFVDVDFEGFFLDFTLTVLEESISQYKNHYAARDVRNNFKYFSEIAEALQNATNLMRYRYHLLDITKVADKINALLDKELLIIPVANKGHATTYIRYKKFLAICDRGEDGDHDNGVVIYNLGKPGKLDNKFMKHIIYKKDPVEKLHDITKKRLGLLPFARLPIPHQTTGNCSWANVESCFPAILFLLMNDEAPTEKQQNIDKAMELFYQWREWDKDRALAFCIESHRTAARARKACKTALLASVFFQAFKYDNPKDVERAKKISMLLTEPEFAYVLKAYIQYHCIDHDTPEGHNLLKLLQQCPIDFEFKM